MGIRDRRVHGEFDDDLMFGDECYSHSLVSCPPLASNGSAISSAILYNDLCNILMVKLSSDQPITFLDTILLRSDDLYYLHTSKTNQVLP